MSAVFGAGDTQDAWVWRDAYEEAEAAMVLFLKRYGRLMRREAGAGPDRPSPGFLQPSPPLCSRGRPSFRYPRHRCRTAICSAMPPHSRLHENAQPRKSAIGGRWSNSTTKPRPSTGKVRQANRRQPMPESTSSGMPGPRAFPARSRVEPRWSNPLPWRRYPVPCRTTVPSCPCVS